MKKVKVTKQMGKRYAVVAAVMVLVGASLYMNWRYAGESAPNTKVLGQATLVNETEQEEAAEVSRPVVEEDDYFATARLSRKQARDSAISMLQEAEIDEHASEDVLNEAS